MSKNKPRLIEVFQKERAILLAVDIHGQDNWQDEDNRKELEELARASNVEILKTMACHRERPTPGLYIGQGKAEEIARECLEQRANVVIFDSDLTPSQQRNLEEIIPAKTIDRSQLILDIFAHRAKSVEGKTQVEYAQLEYLMPRLIGKGIALSQQAGGIGTVGPGEKKLEVDRRHIRRRIAKLRDEIKILRQRRKALRKERSAAQLPTIALVGYTGAGKSTLMNALTNAGQEIRGTLFSTLDTVIRQLSLPSQQKVLFLDTVGFLHRLPHHLVEAFKATLEEVAEADLLLQVLDVSHPLVLEQAQAVRQVLTEIGAEDKPIIYALNKIDLAQNEHQLRRLAQEFPQSAAVSALKKIGIEQLVQKIVTHFAGLVAPVKIFLPHSQMKLLNLIHTHAQIRKKEYAHDGIYLEAIVSREIKEQLSKFLRK